MLSSLFMVFHSNSSHGFQDICQFSEFSVISILICIMPLNRATVVHFLGWANVKLRHAKVKIAEDTVYTCALLCTHTYSYSTKGGKGDYLPDVRLSKTKQIQINLLGLLEKRANMHNIEHIHCGTDRRCL